MEPRGVEIIKEVESRGLLTAGDSAPLLTNNALIPVIGLAEIARFGYTSFEVEFSKMIRAGKARRGQWVNLFEILEVSAKTGLFISASTDETLKQLGLTRKEVGIR